MSKNAGSPLAAAGWLRTQLANSPVAREVLGTLATGVGIAVATVAAMGAVFAYSPSRRAVDRDTCDCTCWDGAFKNGYNTEVYKTAHFSFDERLPVLAAWLAAAFLLATSLARHLVSIALAGEARKPVLAAILVQVYSHHYSFWAGFNYLNEGIWGFMAVQILFAATEIAATVAAASQLSGKAPLSPRALWIMFGVSALHIYHNSVDWTTTNIGMPLMLVADIVQAVIAGRYLYAIVTTGGTTGKLSSGASSSGSSSSSSPPSPLAAEEHGYDLDDMAETGARRIASGGTKRGGPAAPYTPQQLQRDAAGTVLGIVVFSAALRLWQAVSHEFADDMRKTS